MAKPNQRKNRKNITKRISEGCGQGRGSDYQPAIWVRDFSSKGLSTQSKGWKTGRVHHFLSNIELRYFYTLEWSRIVTDIREQYPLPLEETLELAKQCGIPHPINQDTSEPNVITTDFVVTIRQSIGVADQARTIKPLEALQNNRVLEKLEIERQYWEARKISWGIVTNHDIPEVPVINIAWLHDFFNADSLTPLSELDIHEISSTLTQGVLRGKASLIDLAAECDDRLGLEVGESLAVARHLIANRHWLIDINQPIQTREKFILLAAPSIEPSNR